MSGFCFVLFSAVYVWYSFLLVEMYRSMMLQAPFDFTDSPQIMSEILYASPSLKEKVGRFRAAACEQRVLVISDFDHTLTTKSSEQCHDLLAGNTRMPDSFRARMKDFMTNPVSANNASFWWQAFNQQLVRNGFRQSFLDDGLDDPARVRIRPAFDALLETFDAFRLPVLIASAGFSDVIERILVHNVRRPLTFFRDANAAVPYPRAGLHVSANRMIFDTAHRLKKVEPTPPCHSFNKHCTAERAAAFLGAIRNRGVAPNFLLVLGDQPRDVDVIRGFPFVPPENILSVTFCDPGDGFQRVAAAHDLVLHENSSLEPVRSLFDGTKINAAFA